MNKFIMSESNTLGFRPSLSTQNTDQHRLASNCPPEDQTKFIGSRYCSSTSSIDKATLFPSKNESFSLLPPLVVEVYCLRSSASAEGLLRACRQGKVSCYELKMSLAPHLRRQALGALTGICFRYMHRRRRRGSRNQFSLLELAFSLALCRPPLRGLIIYFPIKQVTPTLDKRSKCMQV